LITDRPDFTESGVSVPRGSIQIEGGVTWERMSDKRRVVSGPEALVRYGLGSRMEFRVGVPDYVLNGDESGAGDASLGTKLELGSRIDAWDLAGILTVSIPTGDDPYSSREVDPYLIIAAGRKLSNLWSLGAQFSAGYPKRNDERAFDLGGTLVLGGDLSETSGAFVEIAADFPDNEAAVVSFHTGFVVLLSEELQVDVHTGFGLTDPSSRVFSGAGLSARF